MLFRSDVVARDPSGQQQKGPGKGRIMDILRKVEKYREEEERLKWEPGFHEKLLSNILERFG